MPVTVILALRRFLPAYISANLRMLCAAVLRAAWAIMHCRTAIMGGHLHACETCGNREYQFHSCNHRSCPQCGKGATAEWVERQLRKRVGAPYFMVNFTLPAELRLLFHTKAAKEVYRAFFNAASSALTDLLANPRWLGAATSGFTMVLHTWNQRLHFHPHIHCIVPGAGLDARGNVVIVKSPHHLVPQSALMAVFRARMRDVVAQLREEHQLPEIDPAVWGKKWGVYLKGFGSGENIIKYLGRYVSRTAIGDSRIVSVSDTHVSFSYKDRAKGDARRVETVTGGEFVARYLRHVLPRGLRAIRYHGFCHPAAHKKREIIAFHTGRPLLIGAAALVPPKPPHVVKCPCCDEPMVIVRKLIPPWRQARSPPKKRVAA